MKRVIIESPYAGETRKNTGYARRCIRDSLSRGEAPLAPHLLYTQPWVLDDRNEDERTLGIAAGRAWLQIAGLCAVYIDLGVSRGMEDGIAAAVLAGIPIEYRKIDRQNT